MHARPGSRYGDTECVFGMHCSKWTRFKGSSFSVPLSSYRCSRVVYKALKKGRHPSVGANKNDKWIEEHHFVHSWRAECIIAHSSNQWWDILSVYTGKYLSFLTRCKNLWCWICGSKTHKHNKHPSSSSLSQQATRPPVPIMLPQWYLSLPLPPPPSHLSNTPSFLSSHPNILLFRYLPPFYHPVPPSLTVHYPNQIQQLNNRSLPLHELLFFF